MRILIVAISCLAASTASLKAETSSPQGSQLPFKMAAAAAPAPVANAKHKSYRLVGHRHFLGCVHTHHECEDLADDGHYDHHRAVHNHNRCGEDDLACYGIMDD
jgi:hypothetical protein